MIDIPKKNKFLIKAFLSFFGIGFIPFSPGTLASAITTISWYYIQTTLSKKSLILTLITLSVIPLYFISTKTISSFLKPPIDKSWIVIDEVLGMIISLLPTLYLKSPVFVFLAFLLFRFFDIVKPSFIKQIDSFHTPQSVIQDDLVAGIFSAGTIIIISTFWQNL